MSLSQLISIVGWIFLITPVVIFVTISINMIKGVMAEDDFIRSLVTLGIGVFLTGLVMLATTQFTGIFKKTTPTVITDGEIITENLGL